MGVIIYVDMDVGIGIVVGLGGGIRMGNECSRGCTSNWGQVTVSKWQAKKGMHICGQLTVNEFNGSNTNDNKNAKSPYDSESRVAYP